LDKGHNRHIKKAGEPHLFNRGGKRRNITVCKKSSGGEEKKGTPHHGGGGEGKDQVSPVTPSALLKSIKVTSARKQGRRRTDSKQKEEKLGNSLPFSEFIFDKNAKFAKGTFAEDGFLNGAIVAQAK